jgi:hypothetical protein
VVWRILGNRADIHIEIAEDLLVHGDHLLHAVHDGAGLAEFQVRTESLVSGFDHAGMPVTRELPKSLGTRSGCRCSSAARTRSR